MNIGADRIRVADINGNQIDILGSDLAALQAFVGGLGGGATGVIARAGGGQALATALTNDYNNITTVATAFDSVALPTPSLGKAITVKNSGASTLNVFPPTGVAINALAPNLAIEIAAGSQRTFYGLSATLYSTNEVLSSDAPGAQMGALVLKASNNAADYQVTVTNASFGQATTLTLPDPGAAAANLATYTGAAYNRQVKCVMVPLTGGVDTAGGLLSWVNPEATTILIDEIILDITTASTAACSISAGTTTVNGTTSSANLIDTQSVAAVVTLDNFGTKGTNGKTNGKLPSGKWITVSTASGASAGLVGNAYIFYVSV